MNQKGSLSLFPFFFSKLIVIAFLWPTISVAKPVLFGHLLSQTTESLESGNCTVGFLGVGCGLPAGFNLMTSPFIYANYNMNNGILRWSPPNEAIKDWSAQYAYFKTFDSKNHTYQMESHSLWLTKRIQVNDFYIAYVGFNYMHFLDETAPFSLRREPFKTDPGQSTIYALNEFVVSDHVSFFTEFAVLGLNFVYPNFHFGWSTAYRDGNWFIQLGLSATGLIAYAANATYNTQYQSYKNNNASFTFEESYKMAVSVHPEMNIQYFF